ncbi:prepilin-type N-terminal cleavage/methylation domain-containing protein [Desulfosporosinus fructosivorans]|uniref:Prepilin-type N-terminal cleavage/methylation domain-containing protein n=1 Tax=Desulfosporosinus fructosivorans TaxID=2018669 RepID=A0A4Z0R635_9FIRM|nr:prepilin-type N-terminal cleavage/methylation domain-containing protein [Desulfosporosinus fructosivorans]TGE37835.1 prepilin-type N-terminal cleavage/methylation domain-containing protein [Desulfosporosinus fructosivorans]
MCKVKANDRGFTLLEMMLVLILLAGSGFYLLIKLPVNFEKQRLSLANTQLLEEVRDVRQAALAENIEYDVKFYYQAEDHHYQIFRQGKLMKNVYLKDGIKFFGSPGDNNGLLKFNALGRSMGTTITLTNSSGEHRSVIVAPVGMRIRAE